MGDGDARYAHLLQPVKDLAANWDIDVTANLENYLEDLADTVISFDGGKTTLNFSEAAMIIQSSACIYSKKVEYLYKLINEMLELLANKKKQAKKQQGDDGGGNEEESEFEEDAEEFLSLDDDVDKSGRNYLKENFDCDESFQCLQEVPLSVMPPAEADSGENPLLSESGELLASRNDFTMNKCFVDGQTGILLIEMAHLSWLKQIIQPPVGVQQTLQETPVAMETEGGRMDEVAESGSCAEFDDPVAMEDDDDAGPSLDISMRDNQQAQPNTENIADASLRRSERVKERSEVETNKKQPLLNPYEELRKPKPPTKKGTIFKLPPCREQKDTTRKRKRNNQKAPPVLEPLNVYMSHTFYSNVMKYPKNPMKHPTDLAFDMIFWKQYKKRQIIIRKRQEKKRISRRSCEVQEVDDNHAEDEDDHLDHPDNADGDDVDDLEPLEDDNLMDAINDGLRCDEILKQNLHHRNIEDCIEGSVVLGSYEDLLMRHVEEFMKAAENYVQTSELSLRVAEWQNKIEPRLREEETREQFDVNTYGKQVISRLGVGKTVKFGQIVEGKTDFDVCRTFLVMLMLANTHNVEIQSSADGFGVDNFGVQLLSSRRHFEEIQDFQAPSVDSAPK